MIYFSIVAIVLLVLFFVSCRDPGLLERVTDEEVANNGWFWNEQVGSYRPAGAMYCRECQVSFLQSTGLRILLSNLTSQYTFIF